VAIYADAPAALVYGLVAVATGCMTLTRPVQSALFPQLAHSPDQLVAANVVAGSISAAMAFVGPVTSGVLLALGGAGLALAVFSGLVLMSALLVVRLEPHPPPARIGGPPLREVAAGFRAAAREPDQRLVVGLLVGQSFVAGVVDVLVVVVALDDPGPGVRRARRTASRGRRGWVRRGAAPRGRLRNTGREPRRRAPVACSDPHPQGPDPQRGRSHSRFPSASSRSSVRWTCSPRFLLPSWRGSPLV
jgi:hypothetical protein